MKKLTSQFVICISAFLCLSYTANSQDFVLCSDSENAAIFVLPDEQEPVRLAVEDLIGDVEKITGKTLKIVKSVDDCPEHCVIVGTVEKAGSKQALDQIDSKISKELQGKWESYRVVNRSTEMGQTLVFAGSDERGTMFAIYDFLENYLEVDPMYFWSDREPEKRDRLAWEHIEIIQDEPTLNTADFLSMTKTC